MRFVVRRLGFFLVTLWAAVTLNFLIPRLMPGNAAIAMMSRYKGHVNPQAMHALEIAFGIHNHQSLPALPFIVTAIGGWILTMRNNMITVLTEDYVRMARAKGLKPWRIMWTYAGRNAILPNLVGFAMSLGFVVGGAILVEFVFNYPGVGWMFLQSVENQDYALMQALFLMITVTVLLAILAADVATAILDPRTRERG